MWQIMLPAARGIIGCKRLSRSAQLRHQLFLAPELLSEGNWMFFWCARASLLAAARFFTWEETQRVVRGCVPLCWMMTVSTICPS